MAKIVNGIIKRREYNWDDETVEEEFELEEDIENDPQFIWKNKNLTEAERCDRTFRRLAYLDDDTPLTIKDLKMYWNCLVGACDYNNITVDEATNYLLNKRR